MSTSLVPPSQSDEQIHEQQTITALVQKQISSGLENSVSKTCHFCPTRQIPKEPVSMKLPSGMTIIFCNQDEMDLWKAKYNYQ